MVRLLLLGLFLLGCEGAPARLSAPATRCASADPCRTSTWDAAAARCVEAPAPDGTACATACVPAGRCAQGQCGGAARDCDDADPCTADACDAAQGCVHPVAPALCSAPSDACFPEVWRYEPAEGTEVLPTGVADEVGNQYLRECASVWACELVSIDRDGHVRYRVPLTMRKKDYWAPGGDLLLAGDRVVSLASPDVLDVRRASDGSVVWTRDLLVDVLRFATQDEEAHRRGWPPSVALLHAASLPDGGLVVEVGLVGAYADSGWVPEPLEGWLLRLNADGDVVWHAWVPFETREDDRLAVGAAGSPVVYASESRGLAALGADGAPSWSALLELPIGIASGMVVPPHGRVARASNGDSGAWLRGALALDARGNVFGIIDGIANPHTNGNLGLRHDGGPGARVYRADLAAGLSAWDAATRMGSLILTADGTALVVAEDGFREFDAETGAPRLHCTRALGAVTRPSLAGGRLVVWTGTGSRTNPRVLRAFDAGTRAVARTGWPIEAGTNGRDWRGR